MNSTTTGQRPYDPFDVSTWTPEQIQAWWDFTIFFLETRVESKYFALSSFALVVYEYLITLDQEAELVYKWRNWRKGWNLPNILFVINRYFIFVVLGVILSVLFIPEPSSEYCAFATRFSSLSGVVLNLAASGSLIIRQYAFWDRNKYILWGLVGLLASCCIVTIGTTVHGFLGFAPLPKWGYGLPTGCHVLPPPHLWASFIGVIIFEFVVFVLTMIQSWRILRASGRPLLKPSPIVGHLLKSGTWYFIVMFATAIVTFVSTLTPTAGKFPYVVVPSGLLPAMTSIMCTRLLLYIRSDLREARTPRLQTAASSAWPSSPPQSPEVENIFRPWAISPRLEEGGSSRQEESGSSGEGEMKYRDSAPGPTMRSLSEGAIVCGDDYGSSQLGQDSSGTGSISGNDRTLSLHPWPTTTSAHSRGAGSDGSSVIP